MSKHYFALRQWEIGKAGMTHEEILKRLAVERPDLYTALSAVDWPAVLRHVAVEALKKAAAKMGGAFVETPRVRPEAGDVVGAVHRNGLTTGLVLNGTSLSFFQEGHAYATELDEAKRAIEQAYREEATKAMLQIIGGSDVKEERLKDGSVVVSAKIKEGK